MGPVTVTAGPRAFLFDVFGTCVDWRTGVADAGRALGARRRLGEVDWEQVADAWRARYGPKMEEVRSGRRPWTPLDVLHRESLDDVLAALGIGGLDAGDRDELTLAWHRLPAWPDTVAGLTRLRRLGPVATCSNGNVALLADMAANAGLPWDAILGAEVAQAYKPQPAAYLASVAALGLEPSDVMMVAAHAGDLVAAARCGLRTGFVPRPLEHGPGGRVDVAPADVDVDAADLVDLADRLGAP